LSRADSSAIWARPTKLAGDELGQQRIAQGTEAPGFALGSRHVPWDVRAVRDLRADAFDTRQCGLLEDRLGQGAAHGFYW
jgi:hypothetical protein